MSQVISKICCVCGQDVAQQKRTKDAEGNYYCHPCWSGHLQEPREQEVAVAADPLEQLAAVVPANSAGSAGIRARRGSGIDLALRVGLFLALAFMLLSLLAAVPMGTQNFGAGIASGAASVLLWGGLAFVLKVAAKKRTPPAQAGLGPASNRSVLIALGLIVLAVAGTFLVYYKVYMAPIHDSIVADNARMTVKDDSASDAAAVGDDPAKSFEAFCDALFTEFHTRFNNNRVTFEGPIVATTYSISDKYGVNVRKTQSLTTPYVGTLTFDYYWVDETRSGQVRAKEHGSGTITIVSRDGKWVIDEFSSLFPWKLEDGLREIAAEVDK